MGFEILCCFYSEFNTEKGAEIIYQFPKDYIKQEDFFLKSSRPDGLSPAVVMQERNRPASLRTLLVL